MKRKIKEWNSDSFSIIGKSLLAGIMAFAISSAAVQYIDLDPWMAFSYGRIFLSVLFTMSVCVMVFRNWKTMVSVLSVVLLALVVLILVWAKNGVPEAVSTASADYFAWLWDFISNWNTNMELSWSYSYITSVGVSSIITVLMYFLLVKWFFYIPVFLLSVSLFIAQWAVVREVNKFAFYLTLASLVILYFVHIYFGKIGNIKKSGETHSFLSPGKFIVAALPLVFVLLLTVMLVPKSDEPIKWKWLDDKIKYRNLGGDKPVDFKVYEQFSLANAGFSSEPGTPGGSVKLDFSHILDVYSSEATYLRGESWPYFNGKSWSGSSATVNYSEPILAYDDYAPERRMLLEPIYGWRFMKLRDWLINDFPNYTGAKVLPGTDFDSVMGDHLLPDWYSRKKLDIVYAGVETNTLFAPMYSMLNDFNGLPDVLIETDDTYETKEILKLFSFLHFDYLSLDEDNELLIDTLRQSRRGMYYQTYSALSYITANEEGLGNVLISSSMLYTLQDLFELYRLSEDNYWRYTAVSDTIPTRVLELAAEITKDYDNDYDKVVAIENYFYSGFTYNLEVLDVPAHRDFVDWFLFDTKEGYCTYFATAMTTLVRSIGLPTRYIEGFLTPAGPQAQSRYPVLNSNAHAWVEVYFEGIGWIRFEPTPSFAGILNESPNSTNGNGDEFVDDLLDEHLDELDKDENPVGLINPGRPGGNPNALPTGWLIFILTVVGLAFINITVTSGRIILMKNVKNEKIFRLGYFEILRLVGLRRIKIQRGMTLKEFAAIIDDSYYTGNITMEELTQIYYKIIYDEQEIPEEEFRKMEIFYKEFRHEFNNELKLWEWIIYRILLPII